MNVVKFQTKRRRKPRFSGPVVLLLTGSSKKKSNLRLYVIISKLGQVTMPRQFCLIQGFHGLSIYSEGGASDDIRQTQTIPAAIIRVE